MSGLPEPSITSVSISLTRKQQGALYMKSLRQAERIKALKASLTEVSNALNSARLIMIDKEARDMAGEMVAKANALLAGAA